MFDAKVDITWVVPLVTRAVEAMESMAESYQQMAATAKLQGQLLGGHQAPAPSAVTALRSVRGGHQPRT